VPTSATPSPTAASTATPITPLAAATTTAAPVAVVASAPTAARPAAQTDGDGPPGPLLVAGAALLAVGLIGAAFVLIRR
ncbi:MAG: chitin-binding protein, partial [Chloroflexota bacterium]